MAVYFMYMKTFGRSNGASAVNASAYRSGERLHDERSGRTYDHTQREGVLHKEILLPAKFADSAVAWAEDRAMLWNVAEAAEPRANARVAREFLVALPAELNTADRIQLVHGFARELVDRYGFALDVAVHAPRTDPRNFHAHLLATTREAGIEGLGPKTTLEISDVQRRARGLEPFAREVVLLRERWEQSANRALAAAHLPQRIDHRAGARDDPDHARRPWLPRAAWEIESRGERSLVGDRLRAEVAARERALASAPAPAPARANAPAPANTLTRLEDVRRQAREAWLEMRKRQSGAAAEVPNTRGADEDHSR